MSKLVSINRMEIFRAGKWNGIEFTEADLYAMERNFNHLQNVVRPKVKITHNENQESLAGLASYGDVVSIYTDKVAGEVRLYANIERVPEEVAEWIRDGRFSERSVEMWLVKEIEGTTYRNVIFAVSLLGHEIPAVSGMSKVLAKDKDGKKVVDISDNGKVPEGMMALSFSFDDSGTLKFEIPRVENNPTRGGDKMTLEQQIAKMQERIQALETTNRDLELKMKDQAHAGELSRFKSELEANKATIEELKQFKVQAETMAAENKVLKQKAEQAEAKELEATKKAFSQKVDAVIEKFKKSGKIVPALEAKAREFLLSLSDAAKVASFSEEREGKSIKVEYTQFALFESILESLPKMVEFGELGATGEEEEDDEEEETAGVGGGTQKRIKHGGESFSVKNDDLSTRARKIMERDKCTFSDALGKASAELKQKGVKH